MPQFSLKRLFVSMALIAVGCTMWAWAKRIDMLPTTSSGPVHIDMRAVYLMIASLPVFGAGIGTLFKLPFVGMFIGGAISIVLCLIALSIASS